MVDQFFADTYLTEPSPKVGQSQPIKIIAENGKKYFLKTEIVNNVHQNAVFFQELLCSLLARELKIPVPNFVIIEIEDDFIENNPQLRFSMKFKQGLYFATEEITDAEDNLADNLEIAMRSNLPKIKRAWNGYFRDVNNKKDYAKIITFDFLIQNFDRFTNIGNVLVGRNQNLERTAYAIDHGHAFGSPMYDSNKIALLDDNNNPNYCNMLLGKFLRLGGLSLGAIFQGLEHNIDFLECNPFQQIVSDIECLSEERLKGMIEEIPGSWVVGGDLQKNNYLSFIIRQQRLIRNIIILMAKSNAFSNYIGGELEWIEREELIQDELRGTQL